MGYRDSGENETMKPCPFCGIILDIVCFHNGTHRHIKRCQRSSVAERSYFKTKGHWPRKGLKLMELPAEVPESPPSG